MYLTLFVDWLRNSEHHNDITSFKNTPNPFSIQPTYTFQLELLQTRHDFEQLTLNNLTELVRGNLQVS